MNVDVCKRSPEGMHEWVYDDFHSCWKCIYCEMILPDDGSEIDERGDVKSEK